VYACLLHVFWWVYVLCFVAYMSLFFYIYAFMKLLARLIRCNSIFRPYITKLHFTTKICIPERLYVCLDDIID